MPYTRLFYHLVWGTKNRLPLITQEIEARLWDYLCHKAAENECRVLAVNGCSDHVHLIIEIPPKHAVSDVVKRLKGASAHQFEDLYWQRGYGALTVSERNLEAALDYVQRQKEHHDQQTAHPKLECLDDRSNEDDGQIRESPGVYDPESAAMF